MKTTNHKPFTSHLTPPTSHLTPLTSYLIPLFLLLFTSCIGTTEVPVPKPKGYFRLSTPEVAYQKWDSVMPFSFDYSKNATLSFKKKENNIYTIDIHYSSLSATMNMIAVPVKDNLHQLMWNEEEQVMFHVDRMMTDDIQYSTVNDPDARVFGRLYELEGKYVATPFKFWLTDSSKYFVKGELFFDFPPNNDSLSPIINYLKDDFLFMVENWRWIER